MHVRSTAALLVALVLAACQSSAGPPGGRVAVAPPPSVASDIAIGPDRQARLCASAFADRQNVPINDVTVSGHSASPTGNTIVSLQSGVDTASCEITGAGRVVKVDVLR